MPKYTIKDLELLTGVKPHTIRTWEKRYKLIKPSRNKSNIRHFTEKDLRSLSNIVFLKNHGFKISKIAELSSREIRDMVVEMDEKYHSTNIPIDRFKSLIIEMNETAFLHLLNHYILGMGVEKTYESVIRDIFREVMILENIGVYSRIQRNFLANLIRKYLYAAIENLPVPPKHKKNVYFFMPTDESIDLRLLFFNYIAIKESHRCFHLGHIPEEQITKEVFYNVNPEVIVTTFFSVKKISRIIRYLTTIRELFPEVRILVSGPVFEPRSIKLPSNTYLVDTSEDFKSYLR